MEGCQGKKAAPPGPNTGSPFKDRTISAVTIARVLGVLGKTVIAIGIIILLFAVFQLWGTGILEARSQQDLGNDFDELLEAWPEVRIAVDPKHDRAVEPLINALLRADAIDRVCVGSFSGRRLSAARRLGGPRLCTGLSPRAVGQLQAAAAGVPTRVKAGACAQVPPKAKGVPLVHRRFVDAAHGQNLVVHVWTIDDADEMHRLLDLGVDGIMTDTPTVLRDVLLARGTWF